MIPEVDLPLGKALPELLWREIDQFDLVSHIEHRVRDCFADDDPGDLPHGIGPTFDVLHVKSREDIDARIEQLENVLVTFWMPRARRIRVRELVDKNKFRMPEQQRVEIKLLERRATMLELHARNDRKSLDQRFGFRAPMGFDDPDDHFQTFRLFLPRRSQHRVSLPDPWTHAEENLQPATLRLRLARLDGGEKLVRIGTRFVGHTFIVPGRARN